MEEKGTVGPPFLLVISMYSTNPMFTSKPIYCTMKGKNYVVKIISYGNFIAKINFKANINSCLFCEHFDF